MKTNTHTLELFPSPPEQVAPAPGASQARAATPAGRKSYFNTTRLVGPEKRERESKAKKQREQVLQLFQRYPNALFGPSDVHRIMPWILLGSVRRSMTDLTTDSKLIKTKRLQTGMFGAPEHLWHLKKDAA